MLFLMMSSYEVLYSKLCVNTVSFFLNLCLKSPQIVDFMLYVPMEINLSGNLKKGKEELGERGGRREGERTVIV